MSTTAAVDVAATLGAVYGSANRGPVTASPESGEDFRKVLNEQTAKALDETAHDGRNATAKSTKRNRVTTASTPLASASMLEAVSVAEVRGSPDTRRPNLLSDANVTSAPASALATSTSSDELAGSRRALAGPPGDAIADAHATTDVEDSSVATVEATDTTPVATNAVMAESTPPMSMLTERVTVESKDEGATSTEGTVTTASVLSSASALSFDVTSNATLPAVPSLSSAASAAIRASLPLVANSTPSRSSAPRSELSSTAPANAATSVPRRAEGITVATDRAFGDPVVGPNPGSNARATGNAAPNVTSSDTEPSSLDVSDLASTISQATLGSDGSYTINVAMHPNDLGHVQAIVSLNGADLHVAITPQTPAGHAALASAVESLKSELSRSGLNVNVSLRDPESRSGRGNEDASRTAPSETDMRVAESEVIPVGETLSASQIHLIL